MYVHACVCVYQQPESTKENGLCPSQQMDVAPLLQALNALAALLDRATEMHQPMQQNQTLQSSCNYAALELSIDARRGWDMQEDTTL